MRRTKFKTKNFFSTFRVMFYEMKLTHIWNRFKGQGTGWELEVFLLKAIW